MGLFSKIFLGVDTDAEQQRGDSLDQQLADLNKKALEDGTFTQEQYDQAERDRLRGATGDVNAQVSDAFVQGFKEGRDNIVGGVNKGLSGIVSGVWNAIPLSVWILLLIAFFFYLGGAGLLRRKIAEA